MENKISLRSFYESHRQILLGNHLSRKTTRCRRWIYRDIVEPKFGGQDMLTIDRAELEHFLDNQRLMFQPGTVYGYYAFLFRLFNLLEAETAHPNPLKGLHNKYDPR